MKHKTLFSLLALFTVFGLFADAPAAQKVSRSYHRHHKIYGKGEYYQISREQYGYLIYFQWVKATQTKEDQVLLGLPEPNFWSGFNRRGMFNLIINDISLYSLEPKKVTVFNTAEKSGIDVLYNFDGVWMNLRFFMDDKTPLLHVECTKDSRTKKAVKSMALHMGVSPTITGVKGNVYKREIVTPVSTYNKHGWQTLKKADTYFVMYDAIHEGSIQKPKSNGPAYMKWDSSVWQSARVHYGKTSTISFQFRIKPETEKISFSLLELKKKNTNKEFFDYLVSQKLIKKSGK